VLLLAEETGAPLVEGLRAVADWIEREQRWDARRREALAGPLATSRMLALLPVLSLGMTLFSGEGAVRMLFTTPLGWVLIALSGSLTTAGLSWRRRILRRVRVQAGSGLWVLPPALRVGVPLSQVRAAAERSFLRCGLPGLDAEALRGVGETFARTGTPAVVLVDELIREEHSSQETAFIGVAARAETALLLPIALCHLPAFVLVGVVPLVVGLLSTLHW
jgi:tight adherence protein B